MRNQVSINKGNKGVVNYQEEIHRESIDIVARRFTLRLQQSRKKNSLVECFGR